MLERVCQIPVEQLEEFLNGKDASERDEVKPWDRKRFAKEVNAWIGKAPRPPKPRPPSPDRIVQSFERAVSKMASALQRSNTEGVSFNELRARLHGVLDVAIDELEATSGPETIEAARNSPGSSLTDRLWSNLATRQSTRPARHREAARPPGVTDEEFRALGKPPLNGNQLQPAQN